MDDFETKFAAARERFRNWPTLADVPAEKNPLVALAQAVDALGSPSAEIDRYIQGER